jgi:hypothetical protein
VNQYAFLDRWHGVRNGYILDVTTVRTVTLNSKWHEKERISDVRIQNSSVSEMLKISFW